MVLAALNLPARARLFLLFCMAGGALVTLTAAGAAARIPGTSGWTSLLAGATLVVTALFFLQVHSPALNWRGKTIGITLDEGVILVGFVVLPPPLVVLAAVAATLASQAFLRKHPLKAGFNASVQALANGAAALAFLGVLHAGVPPLGAAVVVPLVVSTVGLSLVGVLMSLLEGEGARRAFNPRLLASIVLTTVAGATFGVLAIGLHALHPAALILLAPLGILLRKSLIAEYRHQNELTTRRALQKANERLVRGSDEDAIVSAGLDACREALDLVSCEIRVDARTWRADPRDPSGPTREVRAPLLDAEGQPMGELRALVGWNGAVRLHEDEETVQLLAASLSMALGTARALRSLREARQGLRDVLDAAREPIVAWDSEGRTVHANEAAAVLFGDGGPESVAALLEPVSAEAFRRAVAAPPEQGAEVEAWTREGRVLEMRRTPITLANGRLGALLVARDVTERRRLEREAAEHREAMARTERLASIGILAGGVAHEINSPLMYMQGNVEMTMMDLEDLDAGRNDPDLARSREQLRTVLGGIERIGRITHGLGVLGRPDRPRPKGGADLADAARRGAQEAQKACPEASAPAQEHEPDPLLVDADPGDLRLVATHLARNALEAARGHALLRTRREGEWAELVVEDDGPGVPPEDLPKLFTPFHTTKPDGTGLGLPISLAIVRSMGGDIHHEPRPGGGARFRVRIPLRRADPPRTRSLLNPDM